MTWNALGNLLDTHQLAVFKSCLIQKRKNLSNNKYIKLRASLSKIPFFDYLDYCRKPTHLLTRTRQDLDKRINQFFNIFNYNIQKRKV